MTSVQPHHQFWTPVFIWERNKLPLCSSQLPFGFWIQNLILESGMLQITSKMWHWLSGIGRPADGKDR